MNPDFLRHAIDIAIRSVEVDEGGPFGAVLVKDNRIISESGNGVTRLLDPTAHAEILCIRDACKNLNDFQLTGCELYSSCEPCPMCFGAIYWTRLDKVYYAASREDAQRFGFDDCLIYNEINHLPAERSIPMIRYASAQALAPFHIWHNKLAKTLY